MQPRETPSRGAFACLQLFQRYSKAYGPDGCYPGQEYITSELSRRLKRPTLGLRTVKRWIGELKDLGAVEVQQRGPRSSTYSVRWTNCDTWQSFLEIAAKNGTPSAESADQPLTDENGTAFGTPFGTPLGSASITESPSGCGTPSGVELGLEHSPTEQHYSRVVNNAAAEKPSPESQTQSPKPESGGNSGQAFDSEVAEILEALKNRPLVQMKAAAFTPVIRSLLSSGETVEIIKRAILRGCWLKLKARHDRGDTSLIFSMRYFLSVIADVKQYNVISDPAYWRNLERRLAHEERQWISSQKAGTVPSSEAWESLAEWSPSRREEHDARLYHCGGRAPSRPLVERDVA
jgi:hypothetical protein